MVVEVKVKVNPQVDRQEQKMWLMRCPEGWIGVVEGGFLVQ